MSSTGLKAHAGLAGCFTLQSPGTSLCSATNFFARMLSSAICIISQALGEAQNFFPRSSSHSLPLAPDLSTHTRHIHQTVFSITTIASIMEPIRRALRPSQYPTSNSRNAPDTPPASSCMPVNVPERRDPGPLDLSKLPLKADHLVKLPKPGQRYLSLDRKRALVNPAHIPKAARRATPPKRKRPQRAQAEKPATTKKRKISHEPASGISPGCSPMMAGQMREATPPAPQPSEPRPSEHQLSEHGPSHMPSPPLTIEITSAGTSVKDFEAEESISPGYFPSLLSALMDGDSTLETVYQSL